MNDARDRVINYLASLNYRERQEIMNRVALLDSEKSKDNSEKNRKSYLKQVERHREIGELMKNTVVVGDIVKCRGTNDRTGFREVLEVDDYGIQARKLVQRGRQRDPNDPNKIKLMLERDGYITSHSWDKVARIYGKGETEIRK